MSEHVDYVDATNTGLSFAYWGKDCGDEEPDDPDQEQCDAADPEDQIERVRIELRINVGNEN